MGAGDEPAGDAAAQRADDAGPAREEQHGEDGDGGTEVLMRIDVRLVFDEGALERRRARDAPAPDEGAAGSAWATGHRPQQQRRSPSLPFFGINPTDLPFSRTWIV